MENKKWNFVILVFFATSLKPVLLHVWAWISFVAFDLSPLGSYSWQERFFLQVYQPRSAPSQVREIKVVREKYWCSTCLWRKMTRSSCWSFSRGSPQVWFYDCIIIFMENTLSLCSIYRRWRRVLGRALDSNILCCQCWFLVCKGEDLSDLAVEYSICPSKEEGGMLGWVRMGQMVWKWNFCG